MCDATLSPLITGQKGIGFKSVFKVTDRPEIHSNGFHLRFDKTCGPMGYILPHWGEDEKPLDTQLTDINQHRWDSCRYTNNINGGFVQVSRDSVTVSHERYQDPEPEAAKWNSDTSSLFSPLLFLL